MPYPKWIEIPEFPVDWFELVTIRRSWLSLLFMPAFANVAKSEDNVIGKENLGFHSPSLNFEEQKETGHYKKWVQGLSNKGQFWGLKNNFNGFYMLFNIFLIKNILK